MKILSSCLFLLIGLLLTSGCGHKDVDDKTNSPSHTEIDLPDARLIDLECGETCAVLFDEEKMAYVMLYLDGSTVTFNIPQ